MSYAHAIDIADLDERTRRAVAELERAIAAQFPSATFILTRSPDDPGSIHLLAIADVDDADEVGDLVIDRVVALHVDEGIPIHVIPLRSPARVRDEMSVPAGVHKQIGRVARLWDRVV